MRKLERRAISGASVRESLPSTGGAMRTLLRVSISTEAGNAAIKEGRLNQVLQSLMADLKPEAAYFLPEQGKRTALSFYDLKDPSQIPQITEPPFHVFNASLGSTPATNAEDLQAGLQAAGIAS